MEKTVFSDYGFLLDISTNIVCHFAAEGRGWAKENTLRKKQLPKTADLLKKGFLSHVFTSNVNKERTITLSTTDLSVLTNIYGHLYCDKLYELLHTPDEYATPAGTIDTRDLKAFTYMRYLLPPGSYWKPDASTACEDTAYCGGTPLALLGARNKHNVSYNTWHPKSIDDLEAVHKVDLFLGHLLASTTIDKETGKIEWLKGEGLIRNLYEPDYNAAEVREIRRQSGHAMTAFRTKTVSPDFKVYNEATPGLRHMMRQSWVWYGRHRSSNMVLNWNDWDKIPKDIDTVSALEGYEPQNTTINAPEGWKDLLI